jgi:hypothetical protein
MLLMWRLTHGLPRAAAAPAGDHPAPSDDGDVSWRSYYTLIALASLGGFVYAAILNFMPRYLDGAGLSVAAIPKESVRNYLTGGVLLLGIIGQYSAGRLARPTTLEPLLALAFFSAAPFVLWMAFAQGTSRLWAAGLFAPLFFMHQPLYNTLVAKYVPRRRRGLCYGLSFSLSFGLGSFGPTFAGYAKSDLVNFGTLSALLVLAGAMSLLLWVWHGPDGESGGAAGGVRMTAPASGR